MISCKIIKLLVWVWVNSLGFMSCTIAGEDHYKYNFGYLGMQCGLLPADVPTETS